MKTYSSTWVDQAMQFISHRRAGCIASFSAKVPRPGQEARTELATGDWKLHSLKALQASVGSLAGKVQAVLAIWSVCLGGFAVAGVEPVEEEGVKGGSAGGAFAWREAEESGKTRKPWWFRHAVRKTASWSSSWDVQFCPG